MRKLLISLSVCLFATLLTTGLSRAKEDTAPIIAFVSILPQKYFVERIAGDLAKVRVLVEPGQSPATYEPTPKQMAELSEAEIFFSIGVPFEERLMSKIRSGFKKLTVVDTRKGITLRAMEAGREDEHDGDHGEKEHGHEAAHKAKTVEHAHGHERGASDPHIWLDPVLVKTQAETICEALGQRDPANAEVYKKNLKSFQDDLDRVNTMISQALAPVKGRTIFVFHPAYGYFAARYGLRQQAVEVGGKKPSAKSVARLIDRAKAAGVRVIFVQPQFDRKNAETVAKAIGGAVVSLDPLAPDYLANLEDMAGKVASALAKNP